MRLGAAGPGPRVGSERVNDHAGAMKAPGPNMRTRIPPIRFKVCLIRMQMYAARYACKQVDWHPGLPWTLERFAGAELLCEQQAGL